MKRGLLHYTHASLRAGLDSEGDAAAGNGGCAPEDCGDPDGARRRGEGPGELGGEAAALQDDQTQPAAQQRDLLSSGLLCCSEHRQWPAGPPAPRRGRGETHGAEEGRAGGQQ